MGNSSNVYLSKSPSFLLPNVGINVRKVHRYRFSRLQIHRGTVMAQRGKAVITRAQKHVSTVIEQRHNGDQGCSLVGVIRGCDSQISQVKKQWATGWMCEVIKDKNGLFPWGTGSVLICIRYASGSDLDIGRQVVCCRVSCLPNSRVHLPDFESSGPHVLHWWSKIYSLCKAFYGGPTEEASLEVSHPTACSI